MIQFNLLPDVKLKYIKAKRQKRLVMLASTVLAAGALTVFVMLLLYVDIAQKKHSSDLSKDITTNKSKVENVEDLDKILTVQNQLSVLTDLHDKKPVAPRLFSYLSQVTPAAASITQMTCNFTDNTMTITGEANSLNTINTFVDTLKFTKYSIPSEKGKDHTAFSKVVLSAFSRAEKTTFTIDLAFDSTIFNNSKDYQGLTLNVPSSTTTRSQIEKPGALFQKSTLKASN